MGGYTLLQDVAIIMVVAGAVMLLFRKLHQPPIVGYLAAGLIISPYTVTGISVTDVRTVSLLADLGLVLLLFGTGLDFSWGKIRSVGRAAIVIAVIESITMFSIGYGLGRLFGWSTLDALFLGAALQVTGTAWIVKILNDLGKARLVSSKLLVATSVVEDLGSVIVITVLSGIVTTGDADLGSIGYLALRLVIFVMVSLVLGAIVVPRIIRFTRQFHSREVLLITSLALCFGMALMGRYLELSVAAGAFLMGALIGDTEHSEEIAEVVTPVKDMFAAVFFVAIGMLIDISLFRGFLVPAISVCAVFVVGKIIVNTVATFFNGYDGKTALRVGMGMPQMGEFSLAAAKLGVDSGAVLSPLYPVVAITTAVTSFLTPYLIRSADSVAEFFDQKSPRLLRVYVSRLSDWLQALRSTLSRGTRVSQGVRRSIKAIFINLLIVIVILGIGAVAIQFTEKLAGLSNIRNDKLGMLLGIFFLTLCAPAFVAMWRSIQKLADEAAKYLVTRQSPIRWSRKRLRIVLRDSIMIVITILIALWTIPLVVQLVAIGSLALAVPLLLLAIALFLILGSMRQIHRQIEGAFDKALFGEEPSSNCSESDSDDASQDIATRLVQLVKLKLVKVIEVWRMRRTKPGESTVSGDIKADEPLAPLEKAGGTTGSEEVEVRTDCNDKAM